MKISNRDFVSEYLSPLIAAAKARPGDETEWECVYLTGDEIIALYANLRDPIIPGDEYVVATAPNGYPYFINVSIDAPSAMVYDVIKVLMYK